MSFRAAWACVAWLLATACWRHPPPRIATVCPAPAATPEAPTSFGTKHPVIIGETSPDRHWAVYCQARLDTNGDGKVALSIGRHGLAGGDDLHTYLSYRADSEHEIEQFLGSDPTGRYLAVIAARRLLLVDVLADRSIPLSVDEVASVPPLSFSANGRFMLYALSRKDAGPELHVRDLCSGAEHIVDPGTDDRFEEAWFAPDNAQIVLVYSLFDEHGAHYCRATVDEWPSRPSLRCGAFVPPKQYECPQHQIRYRSVPITGGPLTATTSPPARIKQRKGSILISSGSVMAGDGDVEIGPLRWKSN